MVKSILTWGVFVINITNYVGDTEDLDKNSIDDREIFKFICDERILRALFESRIFQLRDIQEYAIKKGLFLGYLF